MDPSTSSRLCGPHWNFGNRERGYYKRGLFIERILKLIGASLVFSKSGSLLEAFRVSKISGTWTLLRRPLYPKTHVSQSSKLGPTPMNTWTGATETDALSGPFWNVNRSWLNIRESCSGLSSACDQAEAAYPHDSFGVRSWSFLPMKMKTRRGKASLCWSGKRCAQHLSKLATDVSFLHGLNLSVCCTENI